MAALQNFGTIKTQQLLDEFEWNEKTFYSYLITFNEYEGFFKIVRQSDHEQALIGGQMLFNYSQQEERITKYRIIGFVSQRKPEQRITELLRRRNKK